MPPIINEEICTRCHRCVDACAEDVMFGSKKKEMPVVSYPEFCFHCNCCVDECPVEGAIALRVPLPMTLLSRRT